MVWAHFSIFRVHFSVHFAVFAFLAIAIFAVFFTFARLAIFFRTVLLIAFFIAFFARAFFYIFRRAFDCRVCTFICVDEGLVAPHFLIWIRLSYGRRLSHWR